MKKKAARSAVPRGLSQQAIEVARAARERAYARYSGYTVGAALVTRSGKIISGCNVENASYGLTICAERVAITRAVAEGEREFELLVIATANAAMPCGACLQVMSEFAPRLPIWLVGDRTTITKTAVHSLLPHAFYSAKINERQSSTDR